MQVDPARKREILKLQVVKTLRSLGQGALLVTFALYLDALGWEAGEIGLLLSAGGFFNAVLSIPVGIISDRLGRRAFVLANEVVIVIAAVLAAFSSHPVVISAASVLGAFGRGQVGMIGPAGPAEQAWMAELTQARERSRIYSVNSALGFVGTGIGALLAGLVPWWSGWLPGSLAYRPFFVLVAVTGVINTYLIATTRTAAELEARKAAQGGATVHAGAPAAKSAPARGAAPGERSSSGTAAPAPLPRHEELRIRREENRLLLKLCAIDALNGVAIGLTSPLMAYWFFLKFGAGPSSLGPVFALTFFATALSSITTGRLSERVGVVRSVVSARLAAVALLLVLPLVPYYSLAVVLHVVRSAVARGTVGPRQALAVNLVRDHRRGFASSMIAISSRLPNALGPMVAGFMLDAGQLALPFFLAALMQFWYGVLFGKAFHAHDPNAVPQPAAKAKPAVPGR